MSIRKNEHTGPPSQPLISRFADDSEMAELVEFFLDELDKGIHRMRGLWNEGNRTELCRLVHQLKGAAGGYGFPTITTQAAELEQLLLSDQADSAQLQDKVEDLITLCQKATSSQD